LMFVATSSLILPAAFEAAVPVTNARDEEVLALSRGTAVVLLILYVLYLFFQLRTHVDRFDAKGSDENVENSDENVEESEATITLWASVSTVFVATVAISFCSDYLVGSINGVVESSGISKTFFALIFIPIIGNAGISMDSSLLMKQRSALLPSNWGARIK
jgi:Ca2+:H+ antiporter